MTQKIITLLGRTGDLLSFLPVLHAEFKNGQRCGLLVAEEFAGVMDGIGYADKIVFPGDCWDLTRAMASAWQLSSDVKCVQVAGPQELVKQFTYQPAGQEMAMTDSFVKEAWKISGHFPLWKTQPPLLFDRRDKARENKLLEAFPKKKKVILVSADGKTSPFPHRDLLFKLLKLNFEPKYVVVDLAKFTAERIYDLLALYERAHCLVACDSAPLHLAQACPDLPVVALANDSPSLWHGAPWRANHICYIRYKDFSNRAVEMLDAIEQIGGFGTVKGTAAIKGRKIIHVWSQYDVTPDNTERHKAACWDWHKVYSEAQNWIACRIDLRAIGKDSRTVLKDEHPFPGLKEVVRLGCFRAKDDDVIVLTRADTRFDHGSTKMLNDLCAPCLARRTLRDDSGDTWHPVADLFAFTRAWWFEHEKEIPDLIMGQDHFWPRVLMELMKQHGGTELPLGTIYRSRGKGTVSSMGRAYANHNEGKAREWLTLNGGEAMFPAVTKQVKAMRVNPVALHPYGYNGSIIRHNGRVLMAYRYHPGNNLSTRLAMAEFDGRWNVVKNMEIETPGACQSTEDPRLFTYQGQLWMSWVDADFPSPAPTCVVKVGRLTQISSTWSTEDVRQFKCGKNDGSGLEKNWLFWEHEKEMVWLWKIQEGNQIVYQSNSESVNGTSEPMLSPAPRWPYGEIRGGSSPLPYQGKLLRFFHSSLDFELPPTQRRYFMGAALMESEPPFATVAVSKSPIVIGSEMDDLSETERGKCLPFKQKVVFPAGAIIHEDGWVVSVGINDSECALLMVKEKDLKL